MLWKSSQYGTSQRYFNVFIEINKINHKGTSNLAYCYENGVGCQQDLQKAVKLYEKSGKLGYITGY